jgi:hypothetical protein
MPHSLDAQIAIAVLLFIAALALWRGKAPERWMGVILVANEVGYLATYTTTTPTAEPIGVLIVDALTAFAVIVVASRWRNRQWLKYAAALQLLEVGTHIAVAMDLRLMVHYAQVAGALWTIAFMISVLIGTLQVIWSDRRARRAAKASPPA